MKNETFFQVIDSEQKAYWLGFIVADGNLSKNETVMQIQQSRKDRDHLCKLGSILRQPVSNVIWRKKEKEHEGCYLAFSSKVCWSHLFSHGIIPAKTYHDQSDVFKRISEPLKRHFIRGVFDGDGCVTHSTCGSKENCTFDICGEENLMISIQSYIHNKIGVSLAKPERRHLLTIITWSGKRQIAAIKEWMYKDASVFLERKKDVFEDISNKKKKGNFFGVTKSSSGKWNSSIYYEGKRHHIGNFDTEKEAAIAHDTLAMQVGKPKYKINFTGVK